MIGIVGAGVTGLALSYYLEQAGTEHVVLEAGREPGGAVRTRCLDGRVLEAGPQRTRLTPAVAGLIEDLDLHDQLLLVPTDLPLYIYHGGALHMAPITPRTFLASGLLSRRGKARALVEPLVRRHGPDETVGAFFSRCFGREAYERVLGPLFGGLYGSDPGDMYVRHSLARTLRDLGITGSLLAVLARHTLRGGRVPPACSFRDGMATLPRALYRRQAHRVRLSTRVEAVRRCRHGFLLETTGETLEAERVVFTTPADVTGGLLRGVVPDSAARLCRLTNNPFAVVHFRADGGGDGFGYQVALTEDLNTRGVTWNTSMFRDDGRVGVYTAFLGGARWRAIVDEPDQRIGALAKLEFERVMRREAEVLDVVRTRMPAWDRSWKELDGLVMPEGLHLCTNYVSRAGIPGRLTDAKQLARALSGGGSA